MLMLLQGVLAIAFVAVPLNYLGGLGLWGLSKKKVRRKYKKPKHNHHKY